MEQFIDTFFVILLDDPVVPVELVVQNNNREIVSNLIEYVSYDQDPDYVPNMTHTHNVRRIKMKRISKFTSGALDRSNISHRKAALIVNTLLLDCGMDPKNVSSSSSSIYRHRKMLRESNYSESKNKFVTKNKLVLHLDGKNLPCIDGTNAKQERISIVVTGKSTERLLGIPALEDVSGENIAAVAEDKVFEWNLLENIAGISFDTASINTGRYNGACILLQKKLKKNLLWLACRHHVGEIICSDVYKAHFSSTPASAPYPQLFKTFKNAWKFVDKVKFKPSNDKRLKNRALSARKRKVIDFILKYLNSENKENVRADYLELLNLTLIYFGVTPPNGYHFVAPGAFSNARWMSKAIYILKIYIFRDQFELSMETLAACKEFCLFLFLVLCPVLDNMYSNM